MLLFSLFPLSAVINRCGFNSEGIVVVAKRLGAQHGKRKMEETSSSALPATSDIKQGGKAGPGILGVNLGRTRLVKMLLLTMCKGFIHCHNMLITWYPSFAHTNFTL